LRSRGFGIPEPNSVAALLIMRALSPRQRDWLPGSMREDEPWFWVWGQGPAEEKPQMYPFPLPVHLAPHTLLWTTWGGAAWLDGWKGIRQYGAIAWASTIPFRSQTWWHLSAEHLAAWDRDFVEHAHLNGKHPLSLPGFPRTSLDEDRYDLIRLHTLADELLVRIGEPFLYQHLERYYSQRVPLC